jgi:hypothetical protein
VRLRQQVRRADFRSATDTAAAAATYTPDANSVLNTKVLRVGMECAYAPYNWTQSDDSNGAVKIHNSDGLRQRLRRHDGPEDLRRQRLDS